MSSQSLQLQQGQSLVMTQQLRNSIALLQYSTQELNHFIDSELEKNPLLKRDDGSTSEQHDNTPDASDPIPTDATSNAEVLQETMDMPVEGVENTSRYDGAVDGKYLGQSDDAINRVTETKTLHQDILEQLQLQIFSDIEMKITQVVVDMIDVNGYFPEDILQRSDILGVTEATLRNIISNIQQCEPTGVGARTLRECIALQLAEKDELNDATQSILDNLELLASGNMTKLKKCSGLDEADISKILLLIKSCNPKPGSIYDHTIAQTLIPEVIVRKRDGEWIVELNHDILPKILIDRSYSNSLKERVRDKEEGKVINEHIANASWLVKSLHQRNTTLLNVASEIVQEQQDFFDFGIQYLKPMTLKDIAAKADCHESTVSRITTSKYMNTPRGIFELKYFFSSTLNNANGGEAYSSRSVMHLIKEITDAEKPEAVLSDDAIAEQLNAQGIDVARRTVVKYRKLMNIPSSIQRRRAKKNR